MEKLMYVVWRHDGQSKCEVNQLLLDTIAPTLISALAHQIRLNIADEGVAPAAKLLIQTTKPTPDAIISFWLNSASERTLIEKKLLQNYGRVCGYLVTESEPLPNIKHPAKKGKRTHGMNQVVLLRKPDRLSRESWMDFWLEQHTPIAIRTQATFGYRQNMVVRILTENALKIDAIVEENFPPEAINSKHAFYNAVDNNDLLKKNQDDMLSSVKRFIDLDQIDCLPMSEYTF